MRSLLGALAGLCLALCVPVAVFSTSTLALVFDPESYARGQVEHRVEQVYGLSQNTLAPVNQAIVRYFRADSETLQQSLSATGADPGFFNERETAHMTDVRDLVRLTGLAQRIGAVCAIILLTASVALLRTRAVERVGIYLVGGGALAIALLLLAGAFTAIDFGDLFVRFHLLAFSNDFWVLDPRTDRLIQMFPFGFWRDTMLSLVTRSLLMSVGVIGVGGLLAWLGRRLR